MKTRPIVFLVLAFISFGNSCPQDYVIQTEPDTDQSNNIRNYLMREAEKITGQSLSEIHSLDDWSAVRQDRYNDLISSLGLIEVPLNGQRPALNVTKTGEIQMKGYRIEKLYYESLPSLYVPANLYIPDDIDKPRPAILYLCGHSSEQKVAYQGYARKFAELGFVVLIIETIHDGEVVGEHHGCYSRGWFHWYSRGYTPAGVEVWNAIRGLDLLSERKEVDPEKLGVTGRSGGGAQSWMVAAADERVKVVVPEVGATTLNEQILTRTIDDHCDCMMPINTHQWDFTDIAALIAPRALLIQQGNRDRLTNVEGVREMYVKIKKIYDYYKKPDNVKFLEYQGGHGSVPYSRKYMMSFFMEQLMGKKVNPDQLGDADLSPATRIPADKLRVYVDGPPAGDRTKTIQETFFSIAGKPDLESKSDLFEHRTNVTDYLRKNTFGAFPENPVPFDTHLIFRSVDKDKFGSDVYSYVSEEGWRLRIDFRWKHDPKEKRPLLVVLKQAGDRHSTAENFVGQFGNKWNIAYVNLRGVDQAGWEPGLQWHVRRASAWTGRTIASMQVYDLLRTIEFCRKVKGVDPDSISIAGRDDLGVVALYTALLDGNIDELVLKNPPLTQNQPSRPDGKGEAIEMLNCLRVTDVWQIPALIPETEILFMDQVPDIYSWAQNTRKTLGYNSFQVVTTISKPVDDH